MDAQNPAPADITGRGDADLVPQRDHVLLQSLFELTSVGIQLVDIGRQASVAVNPALVRITGYTHDELMYGDPRERFPAGWMKVREQWFDEVAAHGRFGPAEVEYVHRQGHLIHLVFSGVRVTDPKQNHFLWLNIQDVTPFRAMERELRAAANEDRLTGLANRATLLRGLQARIERAEAAPADAAAAAGFAVMFLDFDRFKLVNDTQGHEAGDALLCGIAGRLRAVALARSRGEPWLVARFGGDEFVVLVPGIADDDAALQEAAALEAALATPHRLKQQAVVCTASIGIARWQPGAGDDDGALLRHADSAMYEAKRRGRGTSVVFDAAMRARLARTHRIGRDLHQALPSGQLALAHGALLFGSEPNAWLKAHAAALPAAGRVLSVADGEGRTTVLTLAHPDAYRPQPIPAEAEAALEAVVHHQPGLHRLAGQALVAGGEQRPHEAVVVACLGAEAPAIGGDGDQPRLAALDQVREGGGAAVGPRHQRHRRPGAGVGPDGDARADRLGHRQAVAGVGQWRGRPVLAAGRRVREQRRLARRVVREAAGGQHHAAARMQVAIAVRRADAGTRSQVIEAVNLFRAKVVDVSTESLTIEATGTQEKIGALLRVLEPYGIREIVQSGVVSLARGPRGIGTTK